MWHNWSKVNELKYRLEEDIDNEAWRDTKSGNTERQ